MWSFFPPLVLTAFAVGTSTVGAPSFVYVGNDLAHNISGYSLDPATGALTPLAGSPFAAQAAPDGVSLHPSGRFLYATAIGNPGTILIYKVDPRTGVLTRVGPPVSTEGRDPSYVTLDPVGAFAFATNFASSSMAVFRIDALTGALMPAPGSPYGTGVTPHGAVVHPSGRFVYAGSTDSGIISAFAIDRATGALAPVPGSPFTAGSRPYSLAVHPSGRFLYSSNLGSGNVSAFQIDPATGALSDVPGSPFPAGGDPMGMTVHPDGSLAYVASFSGDAVLGYAIDQSSGALAPLPESPFPAGSRPMAVQVDLTGRWTYVTNISSNSISAYGIGPTGALTAAPGSPFASGAGPLGLTTGRNFTRGDFGGDGQADLLWRQDGKGNNVVWHMNGATLGGATALSPAVLPDTRWRIVGTHDFNGDRETDILWRHDDSGENVVWHMSGTALVSGTFLNPSALSDVDWQVAGTGDFNQDGRPDILWHHRSAGQLMAWHMDGHTLVSASPTSPSALPDTSWLPVGVSDFNADHRPDVLWRHQGSGQIQVWLMEGLTVVQALPTSPAALTDTSWRIVAVGDYNSDHRPDIAWRHAQSGQNVLWYMDGLALASGTLTSPSVVEDASWRIVGPR